MTVICNVTLTLNPKFKIRNKIENKMKIRKGMKINRVYHLQLQHYTRNSIEFSYISQYKSCLLFKSLELKS